MAGVLRRMYSADRGAALVEFAILLPVLALLLTGMLTAGLAYNQKLQLTHATREGARFAATVSPTQAFTNGDTWANNVRDLVVERSAGDLVNSQVCVSLVEGSPAVVHQASATYSTAGATIPCIPGQTYPLAGTDDGLRVQVTASRPGSIDLAVAPAITFTISTKATAKAEGTG